ncbi:MAG: alpha-glucosidase [Streptosporangiales bacterium]|nr:alpha-glucosidase [Streptosporangiales bacterium]
MRSAARSSAARVTRAPDLVGSVRAAREVVGTVELGAAVVRLVDTGEGPQLTVASRAHGGRVVWASEPGRSFVAGARAQVTWTHRKGAFRTRTGWGEILPNQVIAHREVTGDAVILTGTLHGGGGSAPYRVVFSTAGPGLVTIDADVGEPDDGRGPLTTLVLHGDRASYERFHGFGEQYAPFDLAGRRVPIVVREQGVGRGAQPVTALANRFADGAGGAWDWTYAAMPFYVTSELRGLFLDGPTADVYSVFDLSRRGVTIVCHATSLRARLLVGDTPAELLRDHTAATGRMRALPAWTGEGAVVGVQGGSARVRGIVDRLLDAGAQIAAVWIQDWCGHRFTSFGQRLRWNWEVDPDLYPDWERLVADLGERGVRVLTYTNSFLADVAGLPGVRRDLLAEARDRGYLVRDPTGGPYLIDQDGFLAAPVDLTNSEARAWYVDVLAKQVAAAGVSGWMADFGETLPYDAVLAEGEAATWHNRWPAAWAEVNEEACRAAGIPDCVTFFRSAGRGSPRHARLFWAGDQLVDWNEQDGLPSALAGMLSAGVSGMTLIHGDAGGYTTLDIPLRNYHRSSELLRRWTELSVFGVFLRTHEGNRPWRNVQVYDLGEVEFFARMTRMYAALAPYRRAVVAEAAHTGMPAIRHTWLVHPDSPAARADRQFFFGPSLLVAPVLKRGARSVRVHLPAGRWTHVWSGRGYGDPYRAVSVRVPAPLGQPAVLYPEGDTEAERIAAEFRAAV